jgi:choline dehydrogenase-like flavoprotein
MTERDWPISYQDVAPYYDKVASDVGVSGDAKAEEIGDRQESPIQCRR